MFYKKLKKISKNVVVVVTIVATIVAANWTGSNVAKADTRSDSWNATKLPGYTTQPSVTCTLTKYGGEIKFYTFTLGGADYVAAKCVGANCTIDNSNQYVMRSVVSKTNGTIFKIYNCSQSNMKFKVTVLHNGGINATVYGSGKISY